MATRSRACRAGILAGVLSLVTLAPPLRASLIEAPEALAPAPPTLTVPGGCCVSAAGDFNGDGFADFMTGNLTGYGANVFFGGPALDAIADVVLQAYPTAVAAAGDVNGDGYDDIVAGEPYASVGFLTGAGRALLFLGGSSPDGDPDLVITGLAAYDEFGTSVGGAVDVNGDGFADIIVGIPKSDVWGGDHGEAFVYFGGSTLSSTPGMRRWSPGSGPARFGFSVGTAGDMNGDGQQDLVIGEPDSDQLHGRVYIGSHTRLSGPPVARLFGWVAGTAGDVNHDGFDDLIVGTPTVLNGRVYLYLGGSSISSRPALTLGPTGPSRLFGWSAGTAGDVNGDGYSDIVVGAWGTYYPHQPGHAFVFLGGQPMDATADMVYEGVESEAFGYSVATAGDLDGNGQDDIVVGAYSADRAYVYLSNFNRSPDCGGARAVFDGGWPPNRRLLPVVIAGVTDPDGDPVNLEVTGVTQDEAPGGLCPDAMIGTDGAASVRNERDGSGNGRVYAISFTATDGRGGSCAGAVTVCIPHDQGDVRCTDDGQNYNSLAPCRGAFPIVVEPVAPGLRIVGSSAGRIEFAFQVDGETDVDLAIFDVTGRRVATLDRGRHESGDHRVVWATAEAAPGVYLARGRFGGRVETRRFVVMR